MPLPRRLQQNCLRQFVDTLVRITSLYNLKPKVLQQIKSKSSTPKYILFIDKFHKTHNKLRFVGICGLTHKFQFQKDLKFRSTLFKGLTKLFNSWRKVQHLPHFVARPINPNLQFISTPQQLRRFRPRQKRRV